MTFRLRTYERREEPFKKNERQALLALGKDLAGAMRIITWNGRGFDMPLLGLRAMTLRVPWVFWHEQRHRYENYKKMLVHYDMADQLSDLGGSPRLGLDDVCMMLGLPGKYDLHGSQVGKWWAQDPQRVVQYCIEDVWHTWLIYLRYTEVFRASNAGQRSTVQNWMKQSMAFANSAPELNRWLERMREKRNG
jgi:predicted PolB exonuclease-like 3'-5' exonuclease